MQKQTHKRFERDTFVNETRRPDSSSSQRSHVTKINSGQEYDVIIEGISNSRNGYCHIDEYKVFVKNTEIGEKIRIKLKQVKGTVAYADRIGETKNNKHLY